MIMAASDSPKTGVYRHGVLVDGRVAFYVIDYHGTQSEDWLVEADETEAEVIERLSAALWLVRPRGAGVRASRPILRLL